MSDAIAGMILDMFDDDNPTIRIRRNDLASQLGCVPSQINYVITSRFTPEQGNRKPPGRRRMYLHYTREFKKFRYHGADQQRWGFNR